MLPFIHVVQGTKQDRDERDESEGDGADRCAIRPCPIGQPGQGRKDGNQADVGPSLELADDRRRNKDALQGKFRIGHQIGDHWAGVHA